MRPTPVRHSDDDLAPVCIALGIATAPADLPPEMRALVNFIYGAQTNPNPRARRVPSRVAVAGQGAFGFDDKCVDLKRRQANDFDEE
jgi:hypothetical protein